MSRIYHVKTPTGDRLVEATTKGQAIGHCVSTDYSAEPISSSDLYAAIQNGAKVEKVAVAKKSDGAAPSSSPSAPDLLASGQPAAQGNLQQPSSSISLAAEPSNAPPSIGSLPQPIPATLTASTAPQAPSGEITPAHPPAAPRPAPHLAPIANSGVEGRIAPGVAPSAPNEPAGAPAGGWKVPQPAAVIAANVNPIVAEQQRINPEAAAAAGAPPVAPTPILPPRAPQLQGQG